eukprot:3495039-Prymnesium_polylepis.1
MGLGRGQPDAVPMLRRTCSSKESHHSKHVTRPERGRSFVRLSRKKPKFCPIEQKWKAGEFRKHTC